MVRRLVTVSAALFLVVAVAVIHARGSSEVNFTRVETVAEKTVRLGLTTTPASYAPVVYRVPAQETVPVATVLYEREGILEADLYYPPTVDLETLSEVSLPVIICPSGFRNQWLETNGVAGMRRNLSHIGWATLFAMQGAVAIIYDADVLDEDFLELFSYLTSHAGVLGLDMSRVGIWTTSGHGKFASIALGYPEVVSRVRAMLSVHADPRPTTIPDGDIAFYIIYSNDYSSFERDSAAFARRLEIRGMQVIVDATAPYKGCFTDDPSPETIEIMRRTVIWMRDRLGATPAYVE